ncbi:MULTISPECIES: Mpo1 family 2-hydroxy fatty acid dioxygenase [Inquilinus]|uniref:Membrane protein YGL010W n=1 Tax=Inquilinus ginsengisoli TaxID=363840 RepID=A0ABU1JYB2_9PROT|nr:Mpo1-like protein [Inquilinus ginsengisoli]MDR6292545.1 putative membrane protein YGL010W [Inquilinus ginsengisoli]
MASDLFDRQMAMYTSFHRDGRNRLTHFFGIPAIILAVLVALATVPLGAVAGWPVTLADLVGLLIWLLWIALDLGLGLAMAVLVIPGLIIAHLVVDGGAAWVTWTVAAVLFVGGWALQLVGHAYEGKRPAFLSNLFQLLIGPMFLMAETAFALGLRPGLKHRVEALAAARA